MNVYDFDKTIFKYDCTEKFYFFELKKDLSLLRFFPKQLVGYIKYFLHLCDVTELKTYFYTYLKGIEDIDKDVEAFWDKYIININEFYLKNQKEDDVVISASAYFMVIGALKRLGVTNLIASNVDKKTGEVLGKNCSKYQKIVEFENKGFKLEDIDEFYSDSHKDDFLAAKAKKPYYVVKGKPQPWGKINV